MDRTVLYNNTVALRRDLHKHPETAWREFRTASIVVDRLRRLGYRVSFGRDVIDDASRVGVPTAEVLRQAAERAIAEGADPELVRQMEGGFTGVVGELPMGAKGSGPTVAVRFDMDAIAQAEAEDPAHRPYAEGFSSVHPGEMHACGHDGHVAIGLALAQMLREESVPACGKVKLIFQPAEECVQGGLPMAKAGCVDDVDYFIAGHIGLAANQTGLIAAGTTGIQATSRFDAVFKGASSHAGAKPEEGKNALLAAAAAVLAVNAIPRHSKGATRVNVGAIRGGTARNIVCDWVSLEMETRGATTELNEFMRERAYMALRGAAAMQGVELQIVPQGESLSAESSDVLARRVVNMVRGEPGVVRVEELMDFGAAEDATYFMRRVTERGGQATYMLWGARLSAGHHSRYFDFDEAVLCVAPAVLFRVVTGLLAERQGR
ncbi:MAG TPA: M20 family metallo-hydrolase [Firmicutes bacterium]|nr:M20 family metallo-hydrolase [Bacillota bacterium]